MEEALATFSVRGVFPPKAGSSDGIALSPFGSRTGQRDGLLGGRPQTKEREGK
jgi:hypothetical protein